jgi:hypothetical protein
MPTNVYGPGDNYHPENSHVIAGLIRRVHEAKRSSSSTIWLTPAFSCWKSIRENRTSTSARARISP